MTFLTRLLVVALHALANASFAQTGDAARAAVSRLPLPGERWADIPRFRRDRDRAMIDMLRSIGIEKGKPFNPDAKTKSALKAGVLEAQAWLEAKYDAGLPPFYEGGRWTMPANPEMMEAVKVDFNDPEKYPVDVRGLTYSYAYIGIKRLGAAQFYLISIRDRTATRSMAAGTIV